jgi:hypothetical protein
MDLARHFYAFFSLFQFCFATMSNADLKWGDVMFDGHDARVHLYFLVLYCITFFVSSSPHLFIHMTIKVGGDCWNTIYREWMG